MNKILGVVTVLSLLLSTAGAQEGKPLRIALAGISHGHVWEVSRKMDRGDFVVVGVFEKDALLRESTGLKKKIDPALFYAELGEMLDKTRPEAVMAYGSIYDHLSVVEACAPRGIPVIVEKPLAVNMDHANKMAALARGNGIHLLTNYETTWYATNHKAHELIGQGAIGPITRITICDGHEGPIEIGCGKEFTDWLTDPVLNGGGAVIDFGCYGANLATWLMRGEKPLSVYGVLRQQKPDRYPNVDDDATLVVEYPSATVQIMGSWNWPRGRKDMQVYGSKGFIYQDTPTQMRIYSDKKETSETLSQPKAPYDDVFHYLKAVVRGEVQVAPYDPASLENNLQVVEILESAIKSSKTGQPVRFGK